jgi:hypothetical protein
MNIPGISPGAARLLFTAIALALAFVEFLPLYTGGFEYEVVFLGVHVGTTLAIAFLLISWQRRRGPEDPVPIYDVVLAFAALSCAAYFATQGQRVAERIEGVDDVFALDVAFGILLIALLLEGCRRVAGLVLSIVTAVFIVYVFAGPYIPGALGHRGMSLERFIDLQVLSTSGIFGTPISASAHMVFYFVIVGAFLERSGAGKLFVDIAYGMTARTWGGAGKAAVVASGLFGTISGSAVANVLLSGLMTIPLMKRSGFKPALAGAIEATASTGGQLTTCSSHDSRPRSSARSFPPPSGRKCSATSRWSSVRSRRSAALAPRIGGSGCRWPVPCRHSSGGAGGGGGMDSSRRPTRCDREVPRWNSGSWICALPPGGSSADRCTVCSPVSRWHSGSAAARPHSALPAMCCSSPFHIPTTRASVSCRSRTHGPRRSSPFFAAASRASHSSHSIGRTT